MLDSVSLESVGIPTITVVTSTFEPAARAQAAQLGMADLPILTIADPERWMSEDELTELADALAPRVVDGLVVPRPTPKLEAPT